MKTTSYELYRTRQSSLAKTALEITKRQNPDMLKPLKKLRDEQITRLLLRAQPQFMQSLDSVIIAEELLWEREGCPRFRPNNQHRTHPARY